MRLKTIAPVNPVATPAKTILLVDDDPTVREVIGDVLRAAGYFILCAASGVEALKVARTNQIDLALLDLKLPVQGGWNTFEQLTAQDPLLAVIVITTKPNQLFTALGSGMGAFLEKPLNLTLLLKTVRDLLAEPPGQRLARVVGHLADGPLAP